MTKALSQQRTWLIWLAKVRIIVITFLFGIEFAIFVTVPVRASDQIRVTSCTSLRGPSCVVTSALSSGTGADPGGASSAVGLRNVWRQSELSSSVTDALVSVGAYPSRTNCITVPRRSCTPPRHHLGR